MIYTCMGRAQLSAPKRYLLCWTHMHTMLAPLRSPAGTRRLARFAHVTGMVFRDESLPGTKELVVTKA